MAADSIRMFYIFSQNISLSLFYQHIQINLIHVNIYIIPVSGFENYLCVLLLMSILVVCSFFTIEKKL